MMKEGLTNMRVTLDDVILSSTYLSAGTLPSNIELVDGFLEVDYNDETRITDGVIVSDAGGREKLIELGVLRLVALRPGRGYADFKDRVGDVANKVGVAGEGYVINVSATIQKAGFSPYLKLVELRGRKEMSLESIAKGESQRATLMFEEPSQIVKGELSLYRPASGKDTSLKFGPYPIEVEWLPSDDAQRAADDTVKQIERRESRMNKLSPEQRIVESVRQSVKETKVKKTEAIDGTAMERLKAFELEDAPIVVDRNWQTIAGLGRYELSQTLGAALGNANHFYFDDDALVDGTSEDQSTLISAAGLTSKEFMQKFKEIFPEDTWVPKEDADNASTPSFDTSGDFVNYLENTLIPGLRESGLDSTAADFEEAIYWIRLGQ